MSLLFCIPLLECLCLLLWMILPAASALRRGLYWIVGTPPPLPRGIQRIPSEIKPGRSTRFVPKPPWVRLEVLRLKALTPPRTGCRTIANMFNRRFSQHANPARRASVCKSTVRNWVTKNQYEITVMRRNLKHQLPPALLRNVTWGVDLTGKGDAVGNVHAIFGIVDHGSRAALHLSAVKDKASITLLRALLDTIEKFGKPKCIRTDNESVFASRLFRSGLWWLGIKHQRSALSCPWMNGRIERFFGTFKLSLDQLAVDGCDALNSALVEFRFFYNHVRGHQHLAGLTPAEVWSGLQWNVNDSAGLNSTVVTNSVAAIAALPPLKEEFWFEAWDGLLTGFYLRR